MTTVAIFCGQRHQAIAEFQINYLSRCTSFSPILICPTNVANTLRPLVPRSIPILKDEDVASYSTMMSLCSMLPEKKRNWYRQQLLKIGFLRAQTQPLLLLDGDSIFKASILNLMTKNVMFFTREKTWRYDRFNDRVLPTTTDNYPSFVTNGMYISEKLLDHLKCINLENVINNIILRPDLDFSEYQYFGTFRTSAEQITELRPLKIFRRGDLLGRDIALIAEQFLKSNYDAIAFEPSHRISRLRKIAARVAYAVGWTW